MKYVALKTVACGALLCAASFSHAQPVAPNQNAGNGVLPLPPTVDRLIAIDPFNFDIAQRSVGIRPPYNVFAPQHIPARSIARIFGGDVITTEQFLGLDRIGSGFGTPGLDNGNFANGPGNNNLAGNNFVPNNFVPNGLPPGVSNLVGQEPAIVLLQPVNGADVSVSTNRSNNGH